MSSEKTKIADILVPEVWERYFIERTAETAKFAQSGIIDRNSEFDAFASGPGRTVELPFFKDISGDRQIISDTDAFVTRKITADQDRARIHNDGNPWSTTLLADLLSGEDPMAAIVQLVGEYWARTDESILVSTINGIIALLADEVGSPNVLKIGAESIAATSADTVLSAETFLDAIQKLGDVKDRLTAIAMHSAVESDLSKQDLIDFIPNSEGSALIRTFKGLRVIMDDDLPVRNGSTNGKVYTTVLFGVGAIARGFASLNEPLDGGFGTNAVELTRVPLNHDQVLINRRRHILHPRGIAWEEESVAAAGGPTNGEIANKVNWARKYEAKNIRIVGITHNLASQIDASS